MTPEQAATLRRAAEDILRVLDQVENPGLKRRPPTSTEDRVRELAAAGRTDAQIGEELAMERTAVRSIRRRLGIDPGLAPDTGPGGSGWQDRLRDAHGRGLSPVEIAAELRWTIGTTRNRMARLGLRARRT